jgi:hypothetical protein
MGGFVICMVSSLHISASDTHDIFSRRAHHSGTQNRLRITLQLEFLDFFLHIYFVP